LELLQDPNKCGLLPKGLVIKLSRPNLIFKEKTPDGGERYLEKGAGNTVRVSGDDGRERIIDLSQPVNYLRLSAVELTAVFNHPSINQHSKQAPPSPPPPTLPRPEPARTRPDEPLVAHPTTPERVPVAATPVEPVAGVEVQRAAAKLPGSAMVEPVSKPSEKPAATEVTTRTQAKPLPNLWLESILSQPPIRHDWFACLIYSKLAHRFGNSSEGKFGPSPCWAIALGETPEVSSPAFKGIFLTEKGGLGFLNQGHVARFYRGVVFLGSQGSALEGIDVTLLAIGLDYQQRMVFIVTDNYRAKFGVPEVTLRKELAQLREHGAVVMSLAEVLESSEPIEVVWTVPAEQGNPSDPQAFENTRPGGSSEASTDPATSTAAT
jgi:hypothetical protein